MSVFKCAVRYAHWCVPLQYLSSLICMHVYMCSYTCVLGVWLLSGRDTTNSNVFNISGSQLTVSPARKEGAVCKWCILYNIKNIILKYITYISRTSSRPYLDAVWLKLWWDLDYSQRGASVVSTACSKLERKLQHLPSLLTLAHTQWGQISEFQIMRIQI